MAMPAGFPAAPSNTCRYWIAMVGSLPGADFGDRIRGSQPPLVAHAKCWERFLEDQSSKMGRIQQIGDSPELHSQAHPPDFGSSCFIQGFP